MAGISCNRETDQDRSDLDQLGVAFTNMGEHAAEFFGLMSLGSPRIWSAQARQILLLRERYATDELDLALGHAASFGALEHAAVERILAARATPRTLDEYVAETTTHRLEATLGHARTAPRDLTEYDRLPLTVAARPPTQETSPWPSEATNPSSNPEPTDPATTTSSPLVRRGHSRRVSDWPTGVGCEDSSSLAWRARYPGKRVDVEIIGSRTTDGASPITME